ncbi:psbP domain-containing protein 5, chloroplastic [Mangifera indica]|uniref:psbP domain-containing protein 5, chloroplastic n=1 Tax=Mangifera indica TaxID=29780 RepID=UPI001CFA3A86|nr:psbP domain-containing protein 5, chloroplastic [Mangifera indica]
MQGRILVDEAASSIARMVLLSPLLPLPSLHFLRNEARTLQSQRICRLQEKLIVCSSPSTKPISKNGIWRRDLLLFGLSSSVSLVFPSSGSLAEEDLKMASMTDDINAYSYLYPVEWPSKKFLFKWVESRKPERYSSAAPLSPDARLRIVSERVDIIDNLIISVSIGPPNLQILKSKEKSSWKAKDVVDSVLADKSALRVTSSQRMEESSVLDAHDEEIDGDSYWYYEYLVRKSPSNLAQEANLYRHYVASTAERDGYLYSINASTLSKQWDKMGPFLERTVASFRLLPPTGNYVPPYKDPWRFW